MSVHLKCVFRSGDTRYTKLWINIL